MKILMVHNTYQQKGGEDVVVSNETKLLEARGHKVLKYIVSNDDIQSLKDKISVSFNVCSSKNSMTKIRRLLTTEQPDIVHCHNLFPIITTSIYEECNNMQTPVVQTLHNYRPICSAGTFFLDGKSCTACLRKSPFRSVSNKCYKDSLLGTFAVARMISHQKANNTWSRVSKFIALSHFAKEVFIQYGFDPDKIAIKPNFLPDTALESVNFNFTDRKYVLFVGRLSEEKGIKILLDAWKNLDIPLLIAGEGPLESAVKQAENGIIKYLGQQDSSKILELMSSAKYLVFPSIWFEGFPMVLLEAMSRGLPVIASDLGAMSSIVIDGKNGYKFEHGSSSALRSLALYLESNISELDQLSRDARRIFVDEYGEASNYSQLMDIYYDCLRQAN